MFLIAVMHVSQQTQNNKHELKDFHDSRYEQHATGVLAMFNHF